MQLSLVSAGHLLMDMRPILKFSMFPKYDSLGENPVFICQRLGEGWRHTLTAFSSRLP